uniref:Tripartite motif-containing protein 16-like n=1 Tax=Poecilia formosa TaxID=48698 RepID=A0A087XSQ5_POEFO
VSLTLYFMSEGGRMAQWGISLDEDMLRCAICLDLLKDPVTIPCGHNYCSECIKNHWKGQDQKAIYSCPQCREVFIPRPVVGKNTMLAELVEEIKKVTLQDAPHLHRYVGPGDVSCDFCTGRKMKATKSCLQCLASYCDLHLQPHYDSPAFKTHKLVTASADIQENICSLHNKMKEIFCRSDQQTICFLCSMEKHKGHDTVSAAAERTEWQQELGPRRQDIWQRVQDREEALKLLQKEGDAITNSARDTVENIQAMFNQLLQPLAQRSCDVQQLIGSQQEAEMRQVEELQQRVQQEISELTRRDHELEKLSHTEDHVQFLRRYPSLISLGPSTNSDINIQSPNYFNQITYPITELIQKLQDTLRQEWTRITMREPKTRTEFLPYACRLILDPNTANKMLVLSGQNMRVTRGKKKQSYPNHPERFTDRFQVLSREGLTGRCYWEVEWSGIVSVAVAFKHIIRAGETSGFGDNKMSWALYCHNNKYIHDGRSLDLPGPPCSRIGVYLDHEAGVLSFYSISSTMTLLHRVQAAFTQPLHAGICVGSGSASDSTQLVPHQNHL